jgi:hypothetical protein
MATISFQCYSCHQVLKVGADKAGKRGKCPKCGTMLTIPIASAAPAPAPAPPPPAPAPPPLRAEPVEDYVPAARVKPQGAPARPLRAEPVEEAFDELEEVPPPRPRRRREEEEPYDDEEDYPVRRGPGFTPAARARVGLLLVFIGFCVVAGAFALELIVYLITSIELIKALTGSMGDPLGARATMTLWKIAFPLAFCGSLTAIVGYVFCIIGPNRRGSMGIAIATLAVAAVGLIVTLIFRVLPVFGQEFMADRGVGGGTSVFVAWFLLVLPQLLFCAEIILFPFYLRAFGLARRKHWIADDAGRVVVLGIAYSVVRLLGWIIILVLINAAASRSQSPGLGKAMGWILLLFLWGGTVLYILQLIQYLFLLWRTRPIVK